MSKFNESDVKVIKQKQESESENEQESEQESENESEQESDNETKNSEYTEIDIREDRIYQVLNTFFENEEGENITAVLSSINENIQIQNKILNHIAQTFSNLKIGVEESD